jgi:hypothetical protein
MLSGGPSNGHGDERRVLGHLLGGLVVEVAG